MGKVISVPPPIPKADITSEGTQVKIVEARIAHDVYTQLGQVKTALGLVVEIDENEYSHLFGLDKDPITGSVGRLLVSVGIEDTEDPNLEEKVKALVGTEPKIYNRGGKLYWYPAES